MVLRPNGMKFAESENRKTSRNASICIRERITKGRKAENRTVLNAQSHFAHTYSGAAAQRQVRVTQTASMSVKKVTAEARGGDRRSKTKYPPIAAAPMIIAMGAPPLRREKATVWGWKMSTHI